MLTQFLIAGTLNHTRQQHYAPSERQPLATKNEKDITAAVLAGDQQAFSLLFRRYEKMVYAIALGITKQREDAEEVVQDAFMKAYRYLATWRGDCSFKTWLFRIARTTSLDHLRRKRLDTVSLDASGASVWQLPEPSAGSLQSMMESEKSGQIKNAMRKLSAADEAALMLFYFHEQSVEEVGNTMGWTTGNTKSRLCRARQRLKEVLLADTALLGEIRADVSLS